MHAPPELQLLPPGDLDGAVLLKQKVTMLAGQGRQQFLAVARFEPRVIRLAVLLPSGQRLLTLDYDGIKLHQERAADVDLPGRSILAMMQFAHWPADSLRRHYQASEGWRVEVSTSERRLLTDSGKALTIAYLPRVMHIHNHFREYRVIVETLEKIDL